MRAAKVLALFVLLVLSACGPRPPLPSVSGPSLRPMTFSVVLPNIVLVNDLFGNPWTQITSQTVTGTLTVTVDATVVNRLGGNVPDGIYSGTLQTAPAPLGQVVGLNSGFTATYVADVTLGPSPCIRASRVDVTSIASALPGGVDVAIENAVLPVLDGLVVANIIAPGSTIPAPNPRCAGWTSL